MTTQTYPHALREESGNKVGWKHYATKAEATVAAEVALREAEQLEALGYDWGYQSPGQITVAADGTYRVCVP